MTQHRIARLLSAGTAALALGATDATLAASDEATATIDSIVVTGSRSRSRTELTTPVPVDVLTQEDLRRAAPAGGDLGDALSALLPSFNFPHQSNSGGADHVRAAQLRGMSPDQVLVLVNGKRRHTTAVVNLESKIGKGTNPVDFNSIPINAVRRVEVLRDGAGAQYGSDAIAGVINVILDNASTGGEVEASYGAHHTDFEPTQETLTDGRTQQLQAKYGLRVGNNGGFARAGIEYAKRGATNRAGADQIPFFENQTPPNLALQGQRNYAPGDGESERTNLWFNSELPFAGDLTGYAFGTYTHADSSGAAFFRYPDSSANVPSIYPSGYRPQTTGINQDLSLVAGARGKLAADWDFDASLNWGQNAFEYGVRNSLNASLGTDSPTRFHLGDFQFNQLSANFDATREVALPGFSAPATLALGAEARRESFETQAGDAASYAVGPIVDAPGGAQAGPGLQNGDAVSTSRNILGVYADLSGELTRKLFVNVAARYDHYSDFGDAITGKLSARYEVLPGYALRGSLSNNFRAPSLAQSGFSFTVTDRGDGGALSQVRTLPVSNPIAQALGAEDLKAEKSQNVSFGFTAQPAKGFDLSLDFYQIKVKDRITLSERISGDAVNDYLLATFGVTGLDGVNFFTNAVDTRTRGADLVASWKTPLVGGQFNFNVAASYSKTELTRIADTPAKLAALGVGNVLIGTEEKNTLTSAAPHRREVYTTTWTDSHWALLARLTRHGTTTRVFDFGDGYTPTQTYDAQYQVDAEVEYKFAGGLALALGGTNLTDAYPSRSIDDISYFGNLPYDVLSPIGMNGAYYYGRVRFSF
ncbi:TonB-dependent receptor plug domain-containing protein [Niveibacterium sp.]|uniref:TonB-dependent receptor plug domain-containing protein n=1 Tax=Niveibacterium sp. TaxID=2017444 RepID=UPI0035B21662